MSGRTTVVLFIIALLLGGYLYWQSGEVETAEPDFVPTNVAVPTPERVPLVTNITTDTVLGLEISRQADGAMVQFERRENGRWSQTVPTTTALITQTMNVQVSGLVDLVSNRTLAAEVNALTAYGLAPPAYTIVLRGLNEAGQTVRIAFYVGDETPTDNQLYVQKEGDGRIHIVPQATIEGVVGLLDNVPILVE